MARVELANVKKVYPNGFEAVPGLDLTIEDGELMVLVGPSGCGKTTVLRMVAGLETVSDGEIRIGEQVVNDLGPRDRDVAMVFQNYALYPHMSVADNIGFALKIQGLEKSAIRQKVEGAAKLLGLTEWLDRRPAQLSGGQRQRVAMGRAIVRDPAAFLMDEPLSNLDAKLRVQMRIEVMAIQRRVGVATVYVTHDQVEAMTMGDRVAVMSQGLLQQCDRAQVLYDRPANLFVAGFIGSPAMNLYEGELSSDGHQVTLGTTKVSLDPTPAAVAAHAGRSVVVGVRPETLRLVAPGTDSALQAEVTLVEALGNEQHVHFRSAAKRVRADRTEQDGDITDEGTGVAIAGPEVRVRTGESIALAVDGRGLHLFDVDDGSAILN